MTTVNVCVNIELLNINKLNLLEVLILNIRSLREREGLTQKYLAEQLNVEQSLISIWESGKNQPRADKLPVLAKVLNCKIDDLFESDASQ